MKVRLTVDLTKYHPSLEPGAIGTAIGTHGRQSREYPKAWVGVDFGEHTLDVLRKHLEVVREKTAEGPVLPVMSDVPPAIGDVVDFGGIRFKVAGLQERLGPDLWLLKLVPAHSPDS
jgi:hypothetical protein